MSKYIINGIDYSEYADTHDVDMLVSDHDNNNIVIDLDDYLFENQVRLSFINGQFKQARQQCDEYGLNYELELYKFKQGDRA
jgi:hypothetical protein